MGWRINTAVFGAGLSYVLFDVPWFLRLAWCYIESKVFKRIPKIGKDDGIIYGICSTQDMDFMGHMNNVRYLRELDFARFDFFLRSGLSSYILKRRSGQPNMFCVIRSASIRYRRSINLFQLFSVRSQVVWWDNHSIYFEHRFITIKDDFVRAIAYSHCHIGNCDVKAMMQDLGAEKKSGNPPPDVQRWLEFMSFSSGRLKSELLSIQGAITPNPSSEDLTSSLSI